jgi:hypothetical protein
MNIFCDILYIFQTFQGVVLDDGLFMGWVSLFFGMYINFGICTSYTKWREKRIVGIWLNRRAVLSNLKQEQQSNNNKILSVFQINGMGRICENMQFIRMSFCYFSSAAVSESLSVGCCGLMVEEKSEVQLGCTVW